MTRISAVFSVVVTALLLAPVARADVEADRFSAGGYFRVMARPDLQAGNAQLGFWNLYGRLLNEGPWGALELKLDMLPRDPHSTEIWTEVHARIEGGSFANAHVGQGRLGEFAVTQLYVEAGNLLFDNTVWQIGTLQSYFGDLGLYDMRPADVFSDTVGVSLRHVGEYLQIMAGFGDAGFAIRGNDYNSIFSAGGTARLDLGEHLQLGVGGQLYFEPRVDGNPNAPHTTPISSYEDLLRGEVILRHYEKPGVLRDPQPIPTSGNWWRIVGYLGFGNLGPLRWNNLFVRYRLRAHDNYLDEQFGGTSHRVYLKEHTDQRYELLAGNEMQLRVLPERLDAVWAVLYGQERNLDNTLEAGEDNRTFYSTVLRAQYYLTPAVHALVEGSLAREISDQGNFWRGHHDSIFVNAGEGRNDPEGFQFGDLDTRNTWQLKAGLVLNPLGAGIFSRPSLRFLYGLQRSNAHNAFATSFVDDLDQFNEFRPERDRLWHHIVSIEAEAWF